jgi:hypothetical protein
MRPEEEIMPQCALAKKKCYTALAVYGPFVVNPLTMRSLTATSPALPKLTTLSFQLMLDQAIPMMTLGPKPCPTIETNAPPTYTIQQVTCKHTSLLRVQTCTRHTATLRGL